MEREREKEVYSSKSLTMVFYAYMAMLPCCASPLSLRIGLVCAVYTQSDTHTHTHSARFFSALNEVKREVVNFYYVNQSRI